MKTLITSIVLSLVASIASAESKCNLTDESISALIESNISDKEFWNIYEKNCDTTIIKEKTARQVAAESMLEAGIGGLDGRPSR